MNLELESISQVLNGSQSPQNILNIRNGLKRVLQLAVKGADVLPIIGPTLKLFANQDIVIKKLVLLYILGFGEDSSEVSYLVANTMLQDSKNSNPMVRGLAIKLWSSVSSLIESSSTLLPQGFEDSSPYVKRIAVLACTRFKDNEDFMQDEDYVDTLYSLIRDSDPVVVVNSLLVLNELLADEGGVAINSRMCQYLITLLPSLTDHGQVYVLKILQKYHVKSEEECMFLLNAIDVILNNNNSAVITSAMDLFLHFIKPILPNLQTDLLERVKERILFHILPSKPEKTFILLEKIHPFIKGSDFLGKDYKSFYCGFSDPVYLKIKKMQILTLIANENNWKDIVDELQYFCTISSDSVSETAILAIGAISKQVHNSLHRCLDCLLQLLPLQDDKLISSVLSVIQSLPLDTSQVQSQVVEAVMKCKVNLQTSISRTAFISIVGSYGINHKDSIYIIEEFIDSLDGNSSNIFKLALLTASVKTFLARPAEMQFCLGRLLAHCVRDECPDVSFKASFYHSLLFCDKSLMKYIVSGDKTV